MARQWGTIQHDARPGRRSWWVELWVDGEPFRIRAVPLVGGGRLPIRSREMAVEVLESIRADYRSGRTRMQALAPYLSPDAAALAVSTHWPRFVAAKRRQGQHDRQLSARRIAELDGHSRRGHLARIWDMPIHSVAAGDLEDLRDAAFALGLAPKTVWNLTRDVGAFFRWLERRGDVDRCPPLPPVHVPDYSPRIPSPATLDAILGAVPAELRGQYLARGRMGLRPSEAWRADARDASAEGLVVRGKGNRDRVLPWDVELAQWLAEHPPEPWAPLFANPRGTLESRRWTHSSSRRVWQAACKAVGAGDVRENEGLRHAFATHRAGAGVDMERLSRFLGHTSSKTTRRYARLGAAGLVEVMPRRTK